MDLDRGATIEFYTHNSQKLKGALAKMGKKYDLEKLRKKQMEMADKVITEDRFRKPIEVITGVDLAFLDHEAVVAAVTVNYNTLQIMEKKFIKEKTSFPYIPTFLGFREGPPIIKLIETLKIEPDILMLDSQGISHPLFCGCASHVGVLTKRPAIGVAKSRLCGEYYKEPKRVGDWVPLTYEARTVGAVLKSKKGCRPIFISPGHLVGLKSSIQIVRRCLGGHKLPKPLHLAHRLATEEKRKSLVNRRTRSGQTI